jgi:DNA-binding XRE family transcriptional regulator
MNAPINFQTILDANGNPAFVVVPYNEFQRMTGAATAGSVPNAVVNRVFDDEVTPTRAWREYQRMTQAEVAARMGITQAAYAQIEAAKRPRKATLQKLADALGLSIEQLAW